MSMSSKSGVARGVPVIVNFSDSIRLVRDQIDWTPRGVRLVSKWHFDEGTEIEFAFDHRGARHCCSGIVVGCHPLREPRGLYEMVLFFVEVPCSELQKAACDCRLHRQNRHSGDETHFTTDNSMNGSPRSLSRGR
jgi:hypothetical protein